MRAVLLAILALVVLSIPRHAAAGDCNPNEPCDDGDGGIGRCQADGACAAVEGCS